MGRRSSVNVGAMVSTLSVLLVIASLFMMMRTAESASYAVGDSKGWGFSMGSYDEWTRDKSFGAGDVIVFNYQRGLHNVVEVQEDGYRSCKVLRRSKPLTSGEDKFVLKKGENYFICGMPGHCEAGMKIKVIAN